eukprot:4648397-Prorocentrum_lima.AAC.1
MCQALAEAILCVPLWPEVIAVFPHVLRTMPLDHGDGSCLGLEPKKRSERLIQAGVLHSGPFGEPGDRFSMRLEEPVVPDR